MKKKFLFFILLLNGISLRLSQAQVVITDVAQVYNENFTVLTPANTPWVDNFSLPGWYLVQETNNINALLVNDGSTSIPNIYNFGINADANRSLGALSVPNQSAFWGLHFSNATDLVINKINLSYVGKQWRRGEMAGIQKLQFFFRKGGTNFLADTNNLDWTAQPIFDFISPQTNFFSAILNGNSPTNQTFISNSITSIIIAPGEEFWFRWFFPSVVQFGHGLAIDDISVSFSGISNIINPGPTNNNGSNSVLSLLDVQLNLKKPKIDKLLRFNGLNGFPIKGQIFANTSVVTKASYAAFATSTNIPTNLVFLEAGIFKTKIKKKLAKKGVVALFKHKGKANKPGQGIPSETPSITLIVKVDGTQGTNAGSALFTNVFSSKVK
ncbi:MAG: hypothetical protein K1X66_07150 [Verrucomicrobiae bacterium]|nr:hypothetical protein [Verrucomicrobiae bacterium]